MQPLGNLIRKQQEPQVESLRIMSKYASYGINLDILRLTGYLSEEQYNALTKAGVNGSDLIEKVFGARLFFKSPNTQRLKSDLDRYLTYLNEILQIQKYAKIQIANANRLLNKKFYADSQKVADRVVHVEKNAMGEEVYTASEDPSTGLTQETLEQIEKSGNSLIYPKMSYVVADHPEHARVILQMRNVFETILEINQHYPFIFAHANAIFEQMVLEMNSLVAENISIKDKVVQTIDFDDELLNSEDDGVWK